LWITPWPARAAPSPTASREKPGTGRSSSSSGSTWRRRGSCGSPRRMRATKPRGTRSGNCAAAASDTPGTRPSRPSSASSSRGSRTASRQARFQPPASGRAPVPIGPGCRAGEAAGIIRGQFRGHSGHTGTQPPHSSRSRGSTRPKFPAGVPMASYGMNDVKNGMKILVNGDPAIITDTEYVKPGKGQAFTRVKYRMIKSLRVQEVTMKATDSVEAADVIDTDMQYLYSDGEYWHFMNPESFEQVQADQAGMGGAEKWLKGEEDCVVTL